jgi:hypothetical protein
MHNKLFITSGVVATMLLLGAGCININVTQQPAQKTVQEDMVPAAQPTTTAVEQKQTVEKTTTTTPLTQPKILTVATNCNAFPDKLSACVKYKCQFVHSLTRKTMLKEIAGIVNSKCKYVEQMPNNGKMECNYTESQRKAAAQYYRDLAAAKTTGTEIVIDLGSEEQKTTYTIDGKEVENPMQAFTDNKICVVSGY